jgi:hypothetical protein
MATLRLASLAAPFLMLILASPGVRAETPPEGGRATESEGPGTSPPEDDPLAYGHIHHHDGFYLQIAVGLAYLRNSGSIGNQHAVFQGLAGASHVLLGGTIAPGLVLGGGFQADVIKGGKITLSDGTSQTISQNESVHVNTLGVFADYYFNPWKGLHLQAFVGGARSSTGNDNSSTPPTSLALSLGFGNEWWVSGQWGFGIMGRVQYIADAGPGSAGVQGSFLIPSLLATFTYH